MDKVLHPDRADLSIGKKTGERQGALQALNGFRVMVGFAVEISAAAAAAHQHRAARDPVSPAHLP